GRSRRWHIGEPLGRHPIHGVALRTPPLRRGMSGAAGLAATPGEGELPRLGAERRSRRRALGIGPPRWLSRQEAAPRQKRRVGETAARRELRGDRRRRPP